MAVLCMIGRHRALPRHVRNQGFDFGSCRRCRRALVRSGRTWRSIPKGFRVVWKSEPNPERDCNSSRQLLLDLPCAARALALRPAPSGRRAAALALDLLWLGAHALRWLFLDRLTRWSAAVFRIPRRRTRMLSLSSS
jgi:hypothetical protein